MAVTVSHWFFMALARVTDKKTRLQLAATHFWKPMEVAAKKEFKEMPEAMKLVTTLAHLYDKVRGLRPLLNPRRLTANAVKAM